MLFLLLAIVVSVLGWFIGEKLMYIRLPKKMVHPESYQHVHHDYRLSLKSLNTKRKTYEKKFNSLRKKQQDLKTKLSTLDKEHERLSLQLDKKKDIQKVLQEEKQKIQNAL